MEPADFLIRAAPYLRKGESALLADDGEGRNSVWLAGRMPAARDGVDLHRHRSLGPA